MPADIVFEKDVAVTLRDGVTIYVDVFRPAGTEPVPVIMVWSPYGKGHGTSVSVMGVFVLVGLDCCGVIEWLAEQSWSSGKIGMSGTSYSSTTI